MVGFPLLSLTIFLPLIGALFVLAVRGDDEEIARNARFGALWTSLATFALSLLVWTRFDASSAEFQFVERIEWLPAFRIAYVLGVDGISMPFVLLITLLTPICVLASWTAITVRVKEYMIAFLILETLMLGAFCALDFVLFYIFFEGVLIPMFLIIGIWGGPRRVYSAYKFFFYTLAGSVLLLVALLVLYDETGTTSVIELASHPVSLSLQRWLWLAFFASFAVKLPMWPVHTWLPDAHVEAPTAGSVILAGVLLKLGGYGFLRFSLPILPAASAEFAPLIFALSVIAIIYTSLVALVQEDMKKLIAYSSVAHMGFVTIGIFSGSQQGVQGAVFQMLAHGIVSAALFLCVGVLYDRMHSRSIATYGGLVKRMPNYAVVLMVFSMAAVGLPGTAGFVGEFLVLVGAFQANTWVAALAASGVVLGAAYMLWLYWRVIFGQMTKRTLAAITDLDAREAAVFAPLVLLTLWMGIYPRTFLHVSEVAVAQMLQRLAPLKAALLTGL
ncbi:MAG: NADH-quinone oxidoreductase subunit M [Alphaproteobacteria bacterium]|nr:NADH-quinone oxidoreductase subunit M [Alphaproteobacteria bacterium]